MELELFASLHSTMHEALGVTNKREIELKEITRRIMEEHYKNPIINSLLILKEVLIHCTTRHEELYCTYMVSGILARQTQPSEVFRNKN